jgi:hypothetical protein
LNLVESAAVRRVVVTRADGFSLDSPDHFIQVEVATVELDEPYPIDRT